MKRIVILIGILLSPHAMFLIWKTYQTGIMFVSGLDSVDSGIIAVFIAVLTVAAAVMFWTEGGA